MEDGGELDHSRGGGSREGRGLRALLAGFQGEEQRTTNS